jgi:hypothetical protein
MATDEGWSGQSWSGRINEAWSGQVDLVDADRTLPSRIHAAFERDWRSRPNDWVVVLRCGARRHRHPPRVGEVLNRGTAVRISHHPSGRAWTVLLGQPDAPSQSVRFPCDQRLEGGGRCPADWNIDTARLEAAYRRAVAEGRRVLTLGVDL